MQSSLDSVFIREDQRTVNYIRQQAQKGRYTLPEKATTWGVELRSLFIESILMRIPIPPFYFSETDQGTFIVLNGLERFRALQWFYAGGRLSSVTEDTDGLRLVDLPGRLQDRLADARVLLYYIEYSVPADWHREIVLRAKDLCG